VCPHVTPEQELRQADTPRDSRQVLVLPGDDPHPIESRSVRRQDQGRSTRRAPQGQCGLGEKTDETEEDEF
jgi:hypothetical protein